MSWRAIDSYPRETKDFVPFVSLVLNGDHITDPLGSLMGTAPDVEYAIVPELSRPVTFVDALTVDGMLGFKIDGPNLGRGVYKVYVRVAGGALVPVVEAGMFRLT